MEGAWRERWGDGGRVLGGQKSCNLTAHARLDGACTSEHVPLYEHAHAPRVRAGVG